MKSRSFMISALCCFITLLAIASLSTVRRRPVTLVVGVPLVAQALGEEPVGEPLIESNTSPTITVPTRSRSALASPVGTGM